MFRQQGKPCAHILETLFGPAGEVPYLADKHQNTLRVKGVLMRTMENKEFIPTPHSWDGLILHVPQEVRDAMECALITDEDLKECIFTAQETGEGFINQEGNHLAVLIRRVITYWVEYRAAEDGSFDIVSAYSHRMRFGGGEEEK